MNRILFLSFITLLATTLNATENFINAQKVIREIEGGQDFCKLSPSIRGNKEIVLAAIEQNFHNYSCASDFLKNDRDVCVATVKKSYLRLAFMPEGMKRDRVVVLAAIENDSRAIRFSDINLQLSEDIALAAVSKDGVVLLMLPDQMRDNKTVVLAAVKNFGSALKNASPRLQKDSEVIYTALKESPSAIEFVPQKIKDKYEYEKNKLYEFIQKLEKELNIKTMGD